MITQQIVRLVRSAIEPEDTSVLWLRTIKDPKNVARDDVKLYGYAIGGWRDLGYSLSQDHINKLNSIIIEGDGSLFLSNDGTYKEINLSNYYTKEEIDEIIDIISQNYPLPSDSDPLMNGIVSSGISTKYSREDHIHPSDTSKTNEEDFDHFVYTTNGQFDALNNDIESINNNVETISNQVNINKNNIESLEITTNNINTQVTTNTENITSLTGVLNNLDEKVVHNTGDESIDGVKTFIGEVIIPTPENINNPTTKEYVDMQNTSQDTQIASNTQAIELLQGVSIPIGRIQLQNDEVTQEALYEFAADRGFPQENLRTGYYIHDLDNHCWEYRLDPTPATWIDMGQQITPVFTNTTNGSIKGSSIAGRVSATADGEGEINGLANVALSGNYQDLNNTPNIPQPSDIIPNMDGEGTVGTMTFYSRSDHTHPSDTTKANVSDLDNYLTTEQAANAYVDLTSTQNISGNKRFLNQTDLSRAVQRQDRVIYSSYGAPSLWEVSKIPQAEPNQFEFFPTANINIYASTQDEGETGDIAITGLDNTNLSRLVGGDLNANIRIPLRVNNVPTNLKRIVIDLTVNHYCWLNDLVLFGTSQRTNYKMKVEAFSGYSNAWSEIIPGGNDIKINEFIAHASHPTVQFDSRTTAANKYQRIKITLYDFRELATAQSGNSINLWKLMWFGVYPSTPIKAITEYADRSIAFTGNANTQNLYPTGTNNIGSASNPYETVYAKNIYQNGQPIGGGSTPSDTLPLSNNATASAGTSTEYSRGDHVHPSDNNIISMFSNYYTKQEVDDLIVPSEGGGIPDVEFDGTRFDKVETTIPTGVAIGNVYESKTKDVVIVAQDGIYTKAYNSDIFVKGFTPTTQLFNSNGFGSTNNGNMFVCCGSGSGTSARFAVYKYNRTDSTWSVLTRPTAPGNYVFGNDSNGVLYAGDSKTFSPKYGIFKYDEESDTWTQESVPMPRQSIFNISTTPDGVLIAISNGPTYKLDVETNTWIDTNSIPIGSVTIFPTNNLQVETLDDNLYVSAISNSSVINGILIWDKISQSFIRSYTSSGSTYEMKYNPKTNSLIARRSSGSTADPSLLQLDKVTNTWSAMSRTGLPTSGTIYALNADKDGPILIHGTVSTKRLYRFDGTTWNISGNNQNFSGYNSLITGPFNYIYLGSSTNANTISIIKGDNVYSTNLEQHRANMNYLFSNNKIAFNYNGELFILRDDATVLFPRGRVPNQWEALDEYFTIKEATKALEDRVYTLETSGSGGEGGDVSALTQRITDLENLTTSLIEQVTTLSNADLRIQSK